MKIQEIISILIISTFISCQTKNDFSEINFFSTPQIINSQFGDTIPSIPYKEEFVSEVFPTFVGKYKFQDIVDLNPENIDSTFYKDFISGSSQIELLDSIDVIGFELIVDYTTLVNYKSSPYDSVLHEHYPVYFVNSTNSDKLFLAKDSYVFGIQEAFYKEDSYGRWRPIEGRSFDFCGNGRWGLIVHPKEFVMVLMRKYEGDYETEIRVRFKVGENLLISKPFNGKINQRQFYIQDSSYLQRQLNYTNGKSANWLFYGAIPF